VPSGKTDLGQSPLTGLASDFEVASPLLLNTNAGILRCRGIAGEGPSRLGLTTQQQVECENDVRDQLLGQIVNWDRVRGAQLSRQLFLPNHKPF
jgi:hypothetical protein